ncbi:3-dehydroquinate synthase [Terrihabitans rhizophilus]|uniref:3-dehydroquinate synthase n=1 Tax=Terrihabitans rhizophilus TaxID=3092662 RepID=A0ABU4RNW3_9HYPH|nr:3-dehydroquinate synthase [Terrihabitans sp. PJ23]MDX6806504.1 3-dehydroquinate synthase [Terrihabitans sp. PJ23]
MTEAVKDRVIRVPVELGERSYEIRIGHNLLPSVGPAAAELGARKVAVVTDANVAALHLDTLRRSLAEAGVGISEIVLPPGEATKSFRHLEEVCAKLLEARIERGDLVVALGGGVIGDLAGFAAAILRRGVRVLQVPTSLLAQVDSSVGGKTGINMRAGKNLIGAFHQPSLVLADSSVLDTLSPREFRAGYAEVVKYGLLGDADFFDTLERDWENVFLGGTARMSAIATGCAAKAAIVARDETETGERALLNLGHTFGHALEAAVDYDGTRLVHGEGVAIGMAAAFRFSAELGHCSTGDAERVESHLRAVGLPTRVSEIPGEIGSAAHLLDLMGQDKKVKAGKLTFILVRGIGQSFIAGDVPPESVLAFLENWVRR